MFRSLAVALLLFLLLTPNCRAQEKLLPDTGTAKLADSILQLGLELYHAQTAYETSLEILNTQLSKEFVSSHFVVAGEDYRHTLVFDATGALLYEIGFLEEVDDPQYASIYRNRELLPQERAMYKAMQRVNRWLAKGKKKLTQPENVEFHKLVIANENGFSIYLIPYSIVKSLVPFGNDYRLDFTKRGRLTHIQHFHKELVPVESKPLLEPDEEAAAGIHTHASTGSPYITATDICTLLLYTDYVVWDYHIVLSEKWASIYAVRTRELIIEPRHKFEKGWR